MRQLILLVLCYITCAALFGIASAFHAHLSNGVYYTVGLCVAGVTVSVCKSLGLSVPKSWDR